MGIVSRILHEFIQILKWVQFFVCLVYTFIMSAK